MHRDNHEDFDKSKNDVWAAGVTLLSVLFNEDFSRYYEWDQYRIKHDTILNRLNTLKSHGFSKSFMDILCHMLEIEDSQRPPIHELYNKFARAKSSCNFEPILRGSLNTTGSN